MPMPTYSGTPQQNAMAKANGFPSYDAMILFQQNKERQINPQLNVQAQAPQVSPQGQQAASSWGIAPMFQYLSDALSGAVHR